MPITFDCPCGKTLRVSDEQAGRTARCPVCRAVTAIPTNGPAPATAGGTPPQPPPAEADAAAVGGGGGDPSYKLVRSDARRIQDAHLEEQERPRRRRWDDEDDRADRPRRRRRAHALEGRRRSGSAQARVAIGGGIAILFGAVILAFAWSVGGSVIGYVLGGCLAFGGAAYCVKGLTGSVTEDDD